jgi:thiol-disulfide isomerase/thioredoxin
LKSITVALLLGQLGQSWSWAAMRESAPEASQAVRDPTTLVQLVRSRPVQQELKLLAEQRLAIEKLVRAVEHPLFLLRDASPDQKRERCEELSQQVEQALQKTLSSPQQQRLSEIALRAQGYSALLVPERIAQLNLQPEQVEQLRQALAAANQSSDKQPASLEDRVRQILRPEQQRALAKMVGAPFAVDQIKPIACRAPELKDMSGWINSSPLALKDLEGKVVVVHFWAFGCINCVRNLPWYQAWHKDFKNKAVTMIGIHTPETAQERDPDKVAEQVRARQIEYPVAIDGKASTWSAWGNQIWPAVYLIDKRGDVRYWWYGELKWQGAKGEELMRQRINELLAED